MGATIAEIARAAGVSPATVSRVFGKHPYVKAHLRKRVFEASRRLEYEPKYTRTGNAFAILTGETGGMSMGNFEVIMIRALSRELLANGHDVQIITGLSLPFVHKSTFRGIIDLSVHPLKNFPVRNIPRLTINNPLQGVHSVASDHAQGLETAVNYLAAKKHQRIGFIVGGDKNWGNLQRIKGYRRGLKANRLKAGSGLLNTHDTNKIQDSAEKLMRANPSAVIISGEGMGLRLTHALNLLGLKIPDDVSVISFEDESVSPFLTPPHTTISQDLGHIAKTAVDQLMTITRAEHGVPTVKVMLNNRIIERESVRELAK